MYPKYVLIGLLFYPCFQMFCQMMERPIVVVIPSYNNAFWYKKNIDSVMQQEYQNVRIIYCDDCSTDGTGDLVHEHVFNTGRLNRDVTMIRNKSRVGSLANIYHMVHQCADDEIVVVLDGDDWFAHNRVLQVINTAYADSGVWATYGSLVTQPGGYRQQSGYFPDIVEQGNSYRRYDWICVAPRTFYAGLFKQIKLSDLLYQGSFFAAAGDVAYMIPMLEMAAGKYTYIDDILYIYNWENQYNDFKKAPGMQLNYAWYIRSRQWYKPCSSYKDAYVSHPISIIACVKEENVTEILSWIANHVKGDYTITIIEDGPLFLQQCCKALADSGDVVCMITDALLNNDIIINLDTCAYWMHKTKAEAVHFLSKTREYRSACVLRSPPLNYCRDGIWAWQPIYGEFGWKRVYDLRGGLYNREQLIRAAENFYSSSLAAYQQILNQFNVDPSTVCLLIGEKEDQ